MTSGLPFCEVRRMVAKRTAKGKKPAKQSSGFSRKSVSVLFSDLYHFSLLNEDQMLLYMKQVVPDLVSKLEEYREHLIDVNTWGDGIIFVGEDPAVIARLALAIREFFRSQTFSSIGLPPLTFRIGINAGFAMVGRDALRDARGVVGTDVNVAARVEAITNAGEIWVTEKFAEMSRPFAESERIGFVDLGMKELPKGSGEVHLYRLAWTSEIEPNSMSVYSNAISKDAQVVLGFLKDGPLAEREILQAGKTKIPAITETRCKIALSALTKLKYVRLERENRRLVYIRETP